MPLKEMDNEGSWGKSEHGVQLPRVLFRKLTKILLSSTRTSLIVLTPIQQTTNAKARALDENRDCSRLAHAHDTQQNSSPRLKDAML